MDEQEWALLADSRRSDFKIDEQATFDTLKFEIKLRAKLVRKCLLTQRLLSRYLSRECMPRLLGTSDIVVAEIVVGEPLAHVRVLHSLYTLVGDFTEQIKDYLTTEELDKDQELSAILDQSHSDLFVEYIGDNVYFNREKKNLEETIYGIIHQFNTANENIIANKSLAARLENLDNVQKPERIGLVLLRRKRE